MAVPATHSQDKHGGSVSLPSLPGAQGGCSSAPGGGGGVGGNAPHPQTLDGWVCIDEEGEACTGCCSLHRCRF